MERKVTEFRAGNGRILRTLAACRHGRHDGYGYSSISLNLHLTMPEAKQRLNIAMIGTGFIARAHSNAFNQVGRFFDSQLTLNPTVVCGRDPAKLASFAKRWGWKETTLQWKSVIDRPDIDIVDIAVPNALHARLR